MPTSQTDTIATVLARPAPRTTASLSVQTPQQAMAVFEARRAATFALGLAALATFAVVLVLAIGGDPLAEEVHCAALAVTAAAAIAYTIDAREPRRYRSWKPLALAYVAIFANISGFFYWGVLSAYIAVVPISAYSFASGMGRRRMLGATVVSIAGHLGLGAAQFTGMIGNHGWVLESPAMTPGRAIALLIILQLVLVAAVLAGADAHATMRRVLDEHHDALRVLAQRDAQLAEANAAVRDAHKPGEGRYTGQSLGRFMLGALIGRGGMGEVYEATDERATRCAVKVLAAHLAGDAEALRRFHREARAIGALSTPHIVRMIEVAPPDAAVPFLAMERLLGTDLGAMLHEQPRRTLDEVIEIVRSIAAGLDAAHAAGVIHRDLKPANLFAARDGERVVWKILDFGVSKVASGEATQTAGNIVGTAAYMAPEQARGGAIDRRADVYALGVVAYRMLTGMPAVLPGDLPAMLHEVVFRMPPRPSEIAVVSPAIEDVMAVGLAKSRDDRFATAGELAAAFDAAAAGRRSPELAARAAAIIARSPWGHWLRRTRGATSEQR